MIRRPDPARLMLSAWVCAVLVFMLAPVVLLVPAAFSAAGDPAFPPQGFTLGWFGAFFGDPGWRAATWLSLKVATLTAILTAVIGTMAAYAAVRGGRGIGRVFCVVLMGPVVVPHVVLAVALSLVFGRVGLDGTVLGHVLAHTVLAMPFLVLAVALGLSRVDADLELVAMSCGASRLLAFREVTLPLIAPHLALGGMAAFLISLGEPVVSFFLAASERTLPRRLFDSMEQTLTPTLPAVAVALVVLSLAVIVLAAVPGARARRVRGNG